MNRKRWLITILLFLIIVLGWYWFWFLRYKCHDDWCLLLESRRQDLAAERGILDTVNVPRRQNSNVTNSNTPAQTNTNTVNTNSANVNNTTTEADIQITQPQTNATITSPFTLAGRAREFENVFNYRVRDEDGTILAAEHATYSAPDTGMFGEFNIEVTFIQPFGDHGTVEVFALSARDGSEIDMVRIPVQFE